MEIHNIRPAELARKLNEKLQRVQDILSGKQRTPEDFLTKFIEIFNVDGTWLLTGKGNMYREELPIDRKLKAMTELLDGLNEQQRGEILSVIAEKKRINSLEQQVIELFRKKAS